MTAKQTKALILVTLSDMREVLENMPEGKDKEKLRNAVEVLESIVK